MQLIDPKDPTIILQKTTHLHILLFSKALLSVSQPTLMALPMNFPSLHQELESSLLPLIMTNIASSPMLMEIRTPRSQSKQAVKPLQTCNFDEPDWVHHSPAELWHYDQSQMYHIAHNPTKIPFSLAIRLIPVYTITSFDNTVYQAWALPHLNDALRDPVIDGPPDARTTVFILCHHCAPLTSDHVKRTREAFCSLKQPHNKVATSYLNCICILTRDCYHAGIPNINAKLI